MATYDLTAGVGLPYQRAVTYMLEREVNCATQNLANGDVAQVIDIPAGSLVRSVMVEVSTAEGGAATIDVGDGSDANGFLAAVDVNATGDTAMALALTEGAPNTVTGYSAGKYYAAADTIDVTAGAALDTAVFTVRVILDRFE